MPRYAVISDIHANLEALNAVLQKIDAEKVDRIVCLGDLVGYCANPNECVEIARSRQIACVAGNHDRAATGQTEPHNFSEVARTAILWTRKVLTGDNRHFLENLPLIQNLDRETLIVHAALHPQANDDVRITSEAAAARTIAAMQLDYPGVRICFFGHIHRTCCYQHDGMMTHPTHVADEIKLDRERLYLINPGSVGQSRDHDPRASFCIYDTDDQTVRFHRVEYDYLATRTRLARTPGLLPRRSLLGRIAHLIGVK